MKAVQICLLLGLSIKSYCQNIVYDSLCKESINRHLTSFYEQSPSIDLATEFLIFLEDKVILTIPDRVGAFKLKLIQVEYLNKELSKEESLFVVAISKMEKSRKGINIHLTDYIVKSRESKLLFQYNGGTSYRFRYFKRAKRFLLFEEARLSY